MNNDNVPSPPPGGVHWAPGMGNPGGQPPPQQAGAPPAPPVPPVPQVPPAQPPVQPQGVAVPQPAYKNYVEYYGDHSTDPYHGDYMDVMADYNVPAAGNSRHSKETLLVRATHASLQDHPMAFISLCRKDNAGANDPGTTLITHRVANYPLTLIGPAQPWDDRVFAISGDINQQQIAIVPWADNDFGSLQGGTRVLTTQALNQHWAGNPNDSLVGPYNDETPDTETVYTRQCMYVPHRYTPLVIGASLTPRQAWERLHGAIHTDGKEQECKPLLDFLKVCVTREAAGTASRVADAWPALDQPANEALFDFFRRMVKRDLPGAFGPDDSGTSTYEKAVLQRLGITKEARTCFSFDDSLPKPCDVVPPKSTKPEFVAPDGWLEEVELEIVAQLTRSDGLVDSDTEEYMGDAENDGDETLYRVAPMAVVRCSRGGKTRALYEIANKMRGYHLHCCQANIASLYISFNDYTSLRPWEQEDPLQALLRRIVFMASHNNGKKRHSRAFDVFVKKRQHIEPEEFLEWLGNATPCVLLVDELNNLHELSKVNSPAANELARFIKDHFIGRPNRYLVFSSHEVSTLEYFSFLVDPSRGSSVRPIILQELPITDTLTKALKLKPQLDSAREAIYYGLLPGLIYESTNMRSIVGKRVFFTQQFLTDSQNLDEDFKDILRSLLDGDSMLVPKQLHMILDSAGNKDGPSVIRWVPFHLSFVMSRLATARSFSYKIIADHMAKLCDSIRDSKRFSGDGWEGIFVLFLLARCLTGSYDGYFVPSKWFLEKPKVLFNEPYESNEQRLFSACENWKQLLKSVTPGAEPQLSILFPTHSRFTTYDVLAVYSKDGQNKSIYGYQLKEGTASVAHSATNDIEKSFWIQGKSPMHAKEHTDWAIPDKTIIDKFYGESGKHWTPEQWRKFADTK